MKMILRWFGEAHDSVPLEYIRQVPGVQGVATSLMGKVAGEKWSDGEVAALREAVVSKGLTMPVIESVNIHDDIKLGLPGRDMYIEKYIETLKVLGKAGVRVVCYNFMPMFDWLRTDLHSPLADGSNTMAFSWRQYEAMGMPRHMVERISTSAAGFSLPGWEPERLADIQRLYEQYEGITTELLHQRLGYFLQAVMPVCEQYGIAMAIHPDDPPWPVFGLPRVFACADHAQSILALHGSPYNALTLCTGSLGVDERNDIPKIIRRFGSKIVFAHVRNFKRIAERDFYESAHLSAAGSLDMFVIIKALYENSPDCYIRPDHGRMIWGEQARAGYGLYDRALGAMYIAGIWEALQKGE